MVFSRRTHTPPCKQKGGIPYEADDLDPKAAFGPRGAVHGAERVRTRLCGCDHPDMAKAAQWCTEQGTMATKGDRFDPEGWTPKFKVIEVWNKAFPAA